MRRLYFRRRLLMPLLGLAAALCCMAGLLAVSQRRAMAAAAAQQSEQDARRAAIELVRSMHTKGSFSSPDFTQMAFLQSENPQLPFDVEGYFVEDTVYFFFPVGTDLGALHLSWESDTLDALYCGGEAVTQRRALNCTGPLALTGGGRTFVLEARCTQLPVLSVQTADGALVAPGYGYERASARLWDDAGELVLSQMMQIRVRGNYSSTLPKLPYNIKTQNKFSLFDMQRAKSWCLLANFTDPSLARNSVAFRLAQALGMDYVPQTRYLDVYLNGEYQGVYTLTSRVGLHEGNVDLAALGASGTEGSYMLELDARSVGVETVTSLFGIPLVMKDPSYVNDEQRAMIQSEITQFEQALLAQDFCAQGVRYSDLIDVRSFADTYLVHEILRNSDATIPLSLYVYKDEEGRLAMGPVWDFDLAAGNATVEADRQTAGLTLADSHWFGRLMDDALFRRTVYEEYEKLDGFLAETLDWLDAYEAQMTAAANNNFIITYIGVNDYSNVPQDDPFHKEVEALRTWLAGRFAWLDENAAALWDR